MIEPTTTQIRGEVRRRLEGLELRQAARVARRARKRLSRNRAAAARATNHHQAEMFHHAQLSEE